MAATKFKRGDVVRRPDAWQRRGVYSKGKAIVMEATAKRVVLCTFNPGHKIDTGNPHVGNYRPKGLQAIGKVKKMPKACMSTLKWKREFWKQHPYFRDNPTALAGRGRRKRARR